MKLTRAVTKDDGYAFDFKVINGVLFSKILKSHTVAGFTMNDIYNGTSNWHIRMDDIQDAIKEKLYWQ